MSQFNKRNYIGKEFGGRTRGGGKTYKERKMGKLVVGFDPNYAIVTRKHFEVSLAKWL